MKLSDYFKQQKSQTLSPKMKDEIFSRIQKGIALQPEYSTTLTTKRFFFASKKIMYTSLATVLIVAVFGCALLEKNNVIDLGFLSIESQNPTGVRADYVAEIIEFNGDFSLIRGDEILTSKSQLLSLIHDGDVIKLSEGTKLIFTLADGTQARIDGPAEFSINTTKKGYQIVLLDGKFFRIYCPECVSDIDILTPDTSIHQGKDQVLDIQIAKEEDGEMLVKNNGDEVTVTTIISEKTTETKLASTELVSIDKEMDSIDVFQDSELMTNFLAKNNISGTFSISTDEDIAWPEVKTDTGNIIIAKNDNNGIINPTSTEQKEGNGNDTIVSDTKELVEPVIKQDPLLQGVMDVISSTSGLDSEFSEDTVSLELGFLDNTQQVPSAEQMQIIKTNLNGFFLENLFESIYINEKREQNISQFADRINGISSSFGYSEHAQNDLNSIKTVILSLKNYIEQDRYIAPSYILQFQKVANWCDVLNTQEIHTLEERNSFKSNLPTNLRLM